MNLGPAVATAVLTAAPALACWALFSVRFRARPAMARLEFRSEDKR